MKPFTHFVGIDWSGAKGKRHAGIAVAVCGEDGAVKLVSPPDGKRHWSRSGCADWISAGCDQENGTRVLVGLDSSFSMPFMDEGCYLPGHDTPMSANELWSVVDTVSDPAIDLFGGPFVEQYSEHYLRPGKRGANFKRRMRVTEGLAVSSGAGPCESVFHLIGPSQVGLSGLSTMRMLSRLDDETHIDIWPYDDVSEGQIVLTEIYAAAFASLGGHKGKVRDKKTLMAILENLDASLDPTSDTEFSDHACDALITAAALRYIAPERKYWKPEALSTMVRRTEGWVFGIV